MQPDTIAAAVGVKVASLVAGFAGAVVSLRYIQTMGRRQAALAVATGTLTAAYTTPVAQHVFAGSLSPAIENGVAFLVGLTAMNLIPGIMRLSESFKRDPGRFVGPPRSSDPPAREADK